MSATAVICFSCGTKNPVLGRVGRRDECFKCHADLHVCKDCIHYDVKSYNECREPQADVVQDKTRANFCDYFSPSDQTHAVDPAADLRAKAEALFKKKDSV